MYAVFDLQYMLQPTNHLDITCKEVLEEALQHYPGSVILISHDRYFLSQVANTIFTFENSSVVQHGCDYQDYVNQMGDELKNTLKDRLVEGDKYHITNAKPVLAKFEDSNSRRKNFGGSGVSSGNPFKGVKNAKRFK
jgi:ATP-binding cassette, subfamily F, member 3